MADTNFTYYVNDALGSPVVAMNQAGDVIWRKTYEPYGKSHGKDGDNRIGYTGHVEDKPDLVYAGARYYDPDLVRFLSDDPVRFTESNPMSFNRYAYANNNPYKFVDPDGRETTLITTFDWGIGTHSAFQIERDGMKFLYDPAGSYLPNSGEARGSGDTFDGADASLTDYIAFQKKTGSDVSTVKLATTKAQEDAIQMRAEKQGGAAPFFCASAVSSALDGVGGIAPSIFPGVLEDNAKRVNFNDAKK